MRGHEKERLRKEYIDELKKRHEEEKTRMEQLYTREQAGRRDDQTHAHGQVARLRTEGMLGRLQEELKRLRDFEVSPVLALKNRCVLLLTVQPHDQQYQRHSHWLLTRAHSIPIIVTGGAA